MWRVICDFADAEDDFHVYRAGDAFPRFGTESPERLAVLSGRNNRRGFPLIEEFQPPELSAKKAGGRPRKKGAAQNAD